MATNNFRGDYTMNGSKGADAHQIFWIDTKHGEQGRHFINSTPYGAFDVWDGSSRPTPMFDSYAHRLEAAARVFVAIGKSPKMQRKFPSTGWGFSLLPDEGILHPPTLSVKDQQVAEMHQPVDHCGSHLFVIEDGDPSAELQICRQDDTLSLVTF